jgi:hypothetical protein
MEEFALLFRQPDYDHRNLPAETLRELGEKWQQWIADITSQGRFVPGGLRLAPEGKVLSAGGVITDGPFVEIKEALLSFIVVKAEDLDDAVTLAHGCPAIDQGGSVEVRPLFG